LNASASTVPIPNAMPPANAVSVTWMLFVSTWNENAPAVAAS
jgi:hypothetical protein